MLFGSILALTNALLDVTFDSARTDTPGAAAEAVAGAISATAAARTTTAPLNTVPPVE
jgi:hypothetical protein